MERVFDIASQAEQRKLAYSKQAKDILDSEQKIEREKELLELQRAIEKKLSNLEIRLQIQREADKLERAKQKELEKIERQKDKLNDRWHEAKLIVITALLSGLMTKLLDIFFLNNSPK